MGVACEAFQEASLPVFNASDSITDDSWELVSVMRVLGHYIDHNASIEDDFRFRQKKLWTLWSNGGTLSAWRLPLRCKLALLTRATRCIADQHIVRWPFTVHRAGDVYRTQRKMLQVCEALQQLAGESLESFCRRKARTANRLQKRVVKWDAHIRRDPNFSWPSDLLKVRSETELQQRRWLWSRPRTRVTPGFTNARWTECVQHAAAYEQAS